VSRQTIQGSALSRLPDGAKRLVADRGIATEDRLSSLRENGYRYLAFKCERTQCSVPDDAVRIETGNQRYAWDNPIEPIVP